MIQRIQSIFLFLASGCAFGVLGTSFATTPQPVAASTLFADAKYAVNDNIGLLVLFVLAGALALASIFLYKNRQTQTKICRFSLVANVIGVILAVILLWQDFNGPAGDSINDGLAAYLPFGFLLFGILALRHIKKDEALVRSSDRLR